MPEPAAPAARIGPEGGRIAPAPENEKRALSSGRAAVALVLVLTVLALLLRLSRIRWGLPQFYEEATALHKAWDLWGASTGRVDLNPHFFHYPSLTFYLTFLAQGAYYLYGKAAGLFPNLGAFREAFRAQPEPFILMARGITIAFGALLVPAVYALGRRVSGVTAGLVAALLVAVLPLTLDYSSQIFPDVPLALAMTVALLYVVRIETGGEGRRAYLLAGLWIGLAGSIKYPGFFLLPALLAAHGARLRREGGRPEALLLGADLWTALAAALAAFVVTTPYALLDMPRFAGDLLFQREHARLGHFGGETLGPAWRYYLFDAAPRGFTAPALLLGLLGLAWALLRRPRGWLSLTVATAAYALAVGGWKNANDRYLAPLVPVAAVFAGVFLADLAARARGAGRLRPAPGAIALLAVIPFLVLPVREAVRAARRTAVPDTRTLATAWARAGGIPDGALVAAERYSIDFAPERRGLAHLPFHSVYPHVYDFAYAPELYRDFDYVVVSSLIYERYLRAPELYPMQVRFYSWLLRYFDEVKTFGRPEGRGPRIAIWRNRHVPGMPAVRMLDAATFRRLEGNPPLAEYLSTVGLALQAKGRTGDALEILARALEVDPGSARVYGNLASVYLSAGRNADARRALRKALEREPENAELHYNLGNVLRESGDHERAIAEYAEAIRRKPALSEAYINTAICLVRMDEYPRARDILSAYLNQYPTSPRAGEVRAALEQVETLARTQRRTSPWRR